MKSKIKCAGSIYLGIVILIVFSKTPVCAFNAVQDDTVKAGLISTMPIINGIGDDGCWQRAQWQSIDQVWIPYGGSIAANDFSGKYKVVWSETDNVLCFLVEITDDVFVDGYVYNSDPSIGGGYPNYDIVEVFLDEDKSGGLHVFDGAGQTGSDWGTNAENAFAYHLAVNAPDDGGTAAQFVACDIAGTSWGDYRIANYASHFQDFAIKKDSSTFVWEFSLGVYNDSYDESDPEASKVQLGAGKIMGFSMAYCENDDPDESPKERDNFIGSVWVPESEYNDHWKNADGFGTLKLVSSATAIQKTGSSQKMNFQLYPNPSSGDIHLAMSNAYTGDVSLKIYNVLGQQVYSAILIKSTKQIQANLNLHALSQGLYFFSAVIMDQKYVTKILMVGP